MACSIPFLKSPDSDRRGLRALMLHLPARGWMIQKSRRW
jgi:hypothetical protein